MPELQASPIQRANILGIGVSAIDMADALRTIEEWIGKRGEHYVCITGVHGVMESQRDERLRQIHNDAGLVTPDGMPLVCSVDSKASGGSLVSVDVTSC